MAEAVALTIDDLPWHREVPLSTLQGRITALVTALSDNGIPVTGFVNAGRGGLTALRPWLEAGFTLGNHTYSHVALSQVSAGEFLLDVERNEQVVDEILGYTLAGGWFRYPYLDHGIDQEQNEVVSRFLHARRYTLAPVSVNTFDYAFARHCGKSSEASSLAALYCRHVLDCVGYFSRLSRRLYGRRIPLVLLLHANELNASILGVLIACLHRAGCKFVTLAAALADPAYTEYGTSVPAAGAGNRGDFLGDVAISRGLRLPGDPSDIELFDDLWWPTSGRQLLRPK